MGSKEKESIYDDKVKRVLEGLQKGKKREELAEELGYSSYKSLDTYIRRRNFRWDSSRGTYVPISTNYEIIEIPLESNKVAMAVDMFQRVLDPKEVAQKVGFKDHKDLAAFMRQQGYMWSVELANYIPDPKGKAPVIEGEKGEEVQKEYTQVQEKKPSPKDQELVKQTKKVVDYLPLITFLHDNRERIEQLLEEVNKEEQLPRYILKGESKNKNIHMNRLLSQILEVYSKKNNISQRDVVEAALVEYFRRYNFKEVDDIINS